MSEINIHGRVTEVGKDAFKGTAWLKNQPDGMLYVGAVAYDYIGTMPAGTIVDIKPGTVAICRGALANQANLKGLVLPASLTEIGFAREVVAGSRNITSIVVDPGNPKYDSRNDCNALIETGTNTLVLGCSTTMVPEGVTTIGYQAFYGIAGMKSLRIPDSVTELSSYAIGSCPMLETLDLGRGVVLLDQHAIGATGLKRLYVSSKRLAAAYDTSFAGVSMSACTLYVPEGSETTY